LAHLNSKTCLFCQNRLTAKGTFLINVTFAEYDQLPHDEKRHIIAVNVVTIENRELTRYL